MDVIPYLVTGLPRTGTAWLANFLTTGEQVAVHEPTVFWSPEEVLNETIDFAQRYSSVGFTGPDLLYCYDDIILPYLNKYGDDARVVVIDRKPWDAYIDCCMATKDITSDYDLEDVFETCHLNYRRLMDALRGKEQLMVVDFEDLWISEIAVHEIWNFVWTTLKFDPLRWSLLKRNNVTIRMDEACGQIHERLKDAKTKAENSENKTGES